MSNRPRRSIPFDQWPDADRSLWLAIIAEGDLLDGRGPGTNWAPTSKNNARKAYGYWLHWLKGTEGLGSPAHPLDRITPDRIKAYVEHLQQRTASLTTFSYILDLLRFVKPANPSRDWSWLSRIRCRLWARIKPARDKTPRIRPASDLLGLGLELMDEARNARCRYNPAASPQQFRDGLIIALLASRPVRLKNLTSIEIGRQLVRVDGLYWLRFEPCEVKNKKAIEVPLSQILSQCMDIYIDHYRPQLLGSAFSNRLWISRFGSNLTPQVIRYHIKNRTEAAFGKFLTPHLFRDCAATSIAIEDPVHVRMAASILGHHRLSTTERFYNQAKMLEAVRSHQSVLSRMRRDFRSQSPKVHPRLENS